MSDVIEVEQVSLLFALLSFGSIAIGLVALASLWAPDRARRLLELLVPLAFVIALVCTLGSLYYSGVAGFRPCRLCWWQRIMMYPLVPVLGVAALRRDKLAALYGLPLAIGGLGWAIHHTRLRWFPGDSTSCDAEAACTSVWVNTFGFVSIPFMAAAGFLAVTGLLLLHLQLVRVPSTPPGPFRSPDHLPDPQTLEV